MKRAVSPGWRWVKLGECCEVVSGSTPRRDRPEYWGGEIAWATPRDLSALGGRPTLVATAERITEQGYKSCPTTMMPKGAVLFTSRAPIGLVAIAGLPVSTNQGFKSFVPGPDVDSGYLHWCLKRYAPRIAATGAGSTFSEVSKEVVSRFEIPLPPLAEQRRIAAMLDKADAVRRKRRESLRLLDEFTRSAFLEMFGDPVRNERGWEVVAAQYLLADLRYGTSVKCTAAAAPGALPVLRIPNVVAGEVAWSDLKYTTLSPAEVKNLALRPGDVLFVRTNGNPEYIARCAVFDGSREALFASYLIRARIAPADRYRPVFLKHVVSFPSYRAKLVAESRTTAGNYNISTKGLRRLRFIHPPVELQDKFLELNGRIKDQRAAVLRSARQADTLFGSLAQRAFAAGGEFA